MNAFRADLHCHSIYSDGTDTPLELIQKAVAIGLQGLSITDHDTLSAYPEALEAAKAEGLFLLPGIEFSSMEEKDSVHILAYSFSSTHALLTQFCSAHHQRRKERNLAILDLLAAKGMPISEKEMVHSIPCDPKQILTRTIGRPHIAMAMIKKGYVASVTEAFHSFIGDNKPCFVPGKYFSVDETIETIHRVNGFAILAHPHLLSSASLMRRLMEKPFDGLEGYYAKMPKTKEQRWIDQGRKKNWIITGGSDYHGSVKPHIPLGVSWVDATTFQILWERYLENNESMR